MIFSSYRFLFCFFPVVYAGFMLLKAAKRPTLVKLWLFLASLAFYALGQPDFFAGFLATLIVNYALVWGIARSRRKGLRRLLAAGAVLWNLGLLVYFKYTNFLLENLNRLPGVAVPLVSVILPIGISFFTFQILAYTLAVARGEARCVSPLDYGLFITFFPQLIVGPVVWQEEFLPQIEGDRLLQTDPVGLQRGIMLFAIGAAKKVVIANPLIAHAQAFYTSDVGNSLPIAAWCGVIAFTFAYYFDFSGYIDMARGLGYLFGIRLPINFDSPYKAEGFADFWRRWNITISRFFDRTVFDRLFGFGDRLPRLIFATLVTFLVSGLWHGAAWHFIAWGLVNGALVALSHTLTLYRVKLPRWLRRSATFLVMMLVRVLFDAEGMTDAFFVYRSLFSFGSLLTGAAAFARDNLSLLGIIGVAAVICFCFPNANELCEKRQTFGARHALAAAALLVLALVNMSSVSTFLYFNF